MRGWGAGVAAAIAAAVAAVVVLLYLEHRGEAREAESREDPIVAPSRVQREEHGPVVVLDTAEERRIGLETAVLAAAASAPNARLAAEVIEEPERTATLRAPLSGRLSVPEGASWPALGDRLVAGKPVAQVSDARPLAPPLGGLVTRVGARPGEIVEAGQLLLEVVDRRRPVVRVVWSGAAGEPPRSLLLAPPGGAPRTGARLIGPAGTADPLTRHPVYLYRAERSWPGAVPGTPVSALVAAGGAQVRGAMVPDEAVVQWEGLAWAYRRAGAGRYQRLPVSTDRPLAGGWLVAGPLAPGDTVVVTAAQELLSEEFRARVTVGDESGE